LENHNLTDDNLLIILKVPIWFLPILCLSKRVHSIYLLRLFNDPFVMLFTYASILAMLNNYWALSFAFYSLAVGVKMSALLFSPGILYIILRVLNQKQIFFLGSLAFFTQARF
jgi:hypothetical protein